MKRNKLDFRFRLCGCPPRPETCRECGAFVLAVALVRSGVEDHAAISLRDPVDVVDAPNFRVLRPGTVHRCPAVAKATVVR